MCFSTARSERTNVPATAALFLPWAISDSTSSSRGVRCSSGELPRAGAGVDERLDHLGVDHRTAAGNRADGVDQLAPLGEPLLEQVGPALGPAVEQAQRVAGLDVLRQNDDADIWVAGAQFGCRPDPLVGAGRRHADVGQHDIRRVLVDGGQ